MRLLKWHDTSTYRYLASTKPLFGLLVTWKWDSSRFMKLLVGAFVEHLFFILAAWKSDFYRVVKSSSRKHLVSSQPLLDILATQKGSREPRIKILCFRYVNLQHFEGLKLRILVSWNLRLKVMWLPVGLFWTFWCPQNAILSSCRTLSSSIHRF